MTMITQPVKGRWEAVRAFIRAAHRDIRGYVPELGSPEWSALQDGDRRKYAAVGVAAERWVLEHEMAELREIKAHAQAMKAASLEVLDGLKTARPTGRYDEEPFGAIDTRRCEAPFPYGGAA